MRRRETVVFGGIGAVLFLYVVYPFAAFFIGTRGAGSDVGSGFREAVVNSLVTAPVATAIATVFGVPLAYFLSRAEFRGKVVVEALVVLPLVLPPVVGGAMLLMGFGRLTTVGSIAVSMGVPLTDSLVGVVLAQTFVASPFVVVTSRAGFSSVDEDLEHASRTMGHGPIATFWNVSLPSARTAVGAGVVLTFARAIGEFGATMMVAYNPRTMPTLIWVDFIARGVDGVVAPALVLIGVSLTVIVAVQRLERIPRLRR
ncbi:MAG: molybdate/tungstate transport system permease protein [Methanobacteriota archaeon]|jgi:molybdate/tungstate transport system permease protein|uniref:ABC transporter permease n=1 Tax=Halorutilus salinus TaxID=2487751 RepID=A0A9Q4GI42_9EURY|nr:ABC transporter permease [Halorutilus salinus]MCX2819470.1 ABC transporter permease [Halorutilus salinus]